MEKESTSKFVDLWCGRCGNKFSITASAVLKRERRNFVSKSWCVDCIEVSGRWDWDIDREVIDRVVAKFKGE